MAGIAVLVADSGRPPWRATQLHSEQRRGGCDLGSADRPGHSIDTPQPSVALIRTCCCRPAAGVPSRRQMKAVILAGGLGTRLSEETGRPRQADDRDRRQADPLAHHEDLLAARHQRLRHLPGLQGLHDQGVLRQLLPAHLGRHVRPRPQRDAACIRTNAEPWRVTLVDTGERDHDRRSPASASASTSATSDLLLHLRRRRVRRRHRAAASRFHREQGTLATVTAVQPPGRFGALDIDGDAHRRASRKSRRATAAWINGGFFVLQPRVIDYIDGDATVLGTRAAGDGWRATASWRPIATTASGSPWIRCATRISSRSSGRSGNAPWKQLGLTRCSGPYAGRRVLVTGHTGLQGIVAGALAAAAGRRGGRAGARPRHAAVATGASLACPRHGRRVTFGMPPAWSRPVAVPPRDRAAPGGTAAGRRSYREPAATFAVNVGGLVNLFEAVRRCPSVRAVVNATTDKVYEAAASPGLP